MSRARRGIAPAHLLVSGAVIAAALIHTGGQYFRAPIVPRQTEVFFSPKGGCTEAVVNELRHAQKSVLVQAFSYTSPQIARALIDCQRRGLSVKVILDKSELTDKYSELEFTTHAGIPTWIDSVHSIAHNKVMIIDGETVITGSFNFTRQAEEHNAENLLIVHKTPALAEEYAHNWEAHQRHSDVYHGR